LLVIIEADVARSNGRWHGREMILTCPSNASWVKRSPFIHTEHGLGPLRVSFIVRQVEQPLGGASIQPPLCPFSHYVPRTRLWKRFSPSPRLRRPARRFPGDLRAARNPERCIRYTGVNKRLFLSIFLSLTGSAFTFVVD